MLFDNKVQVEFEYDLLQKTHNLNSEIELAGLVIDWQFANTERMFDDFVEPVTDYQPIYAYA